MSDLRCLDGPADCAGPIELRTTPDRTDFKHFARCEYHFELRLDLAAKNDLIGDTPPSWFDPTNAGERWDDE